MVSEGSVTLSLGSVLLDLLHMVCSGSELLTLWLTGRRGREGGREGGRTRDKTPQRTTCHLPKVPEPLKIAPIS